jgi:hypothetical protein
MLLLWGGERGPGRRAGIGLWEGCQNDQFPAAKSDGSSHVDQEIILYISVDWRYVGLQPAGLRLVDVLPTSQRKSRLQNRVRK